MRKYTVVFLCLTIMTACNIQIPQSLNITGNPTVFLPLGSPFNLLDEDDKTLEYYVSLEGIRDMMDKNASGSNIRVYNYEVDEESRKYQTYVVHYPLAEMSLDLTDYVDKKLNDALNIDGEQIDVNVPIEPPTFPDYSGPIYPYFLTPEGPVKTEEPLYNIKLDDMYKMVHEVEGDAFGLEIPYSDGFRDNLMVKIPGFGIDKYIYGKKEGDKLRFISDDKTFKPGDLLDAALQIYFQVTGPCSGIEQPALVFEWNTALVDTTDSDRFSGEYPIENDLGKFLGAGVSFRDVQGFAYADGIENATLSLTYQQSGYPPVDLYPNKKLESQERPVFSDIVTEKLPEENNLDSVQLIKMLNRIDAVTLKYKINMNTMTIYNKPESISGRAITADLVILLPLVFKAEAPSGYDQYDNYAKISLNDLFPLPSGDKDIFMRNKDGDGLISNVSFIRIILRNYQNNILDADELGILLTAGSGEGQYLNYFKMAGKEPFLHIDHFKDLPNPFNPAFDVLVKKTAGEDYALFGINRQTPHSRFYFTMMVEAKTDIDQTIQFNK